MLIRFQMCSHPCVSARVLKQRQPVFIVAHLLLFYKNYKIEEKKTNTATAATVCLCFLRNLSRRFVHVSKSIKCASNRFNFEKKILFSHIFFSLQLDCLTKRENRSLQRWPVRNRFQRSMLKKLNQRNCHSHFDIQYFTYKRTIFNAQRTSPIESCIKMAFHATNAIGFEMKCRRFNK